MQIIYLYRKQDTKCSIQNCKKHINQKLAQHDLNLRTNKEKTRSIRHVQDLLPFRIEEEDTILQCVRFPFFFDAVTRGLNGGHLAPRREQRNASKCRRSKSPSELRRAAGEERVRGSVKQSSDRCSHGCFVFFSSLY